MFVFSMCTLILKCICVCSYSEGYTSLLIWWCWGGCCSKKTFLLKLNHIVGRLSSQPFRWNLFSHMPRGRKWFWMFAAYPVSAVNKLILYNFIESPSVLKYYSQMVSPNMSSRGTFGGRTTSLRLAMNVRIFCEKKSESTWWLTVFRLQLFTHKGSASGQMKGNWSQSYSRGELWQFYTSSLFTCAGELSKLCKTLCGSREDLVNCLKWHSVTQQWGKSGGVS